jgi:hypothetical protein
VCFVSSFRKLYENQSFFGIDCIISIIITAVLTKQCTAYFLYVLLNVSLWICAVFVLDYLLSSVVAFLLLANWLFIQHLNEYNCSEFNYSIQILYWTIILTCTKDPNCILVRLPYVRAEFVKLVDFVYSPLT